MSFDGVLLEDLAAPQKNAIVGGPFGSNLVSKDYVDQGTPVIRGQNMGGRWVSGDFAYVSAMKAEALSPNKARPGDLIFTQRGTLGQVSIVPSGPYDEYIVSQSQMKVTLDPERADVHFLYYVFRSPEQLEYIQNTAIQTGVPHTNLGILKKTPLKLPSIHTQRQIATILGTLDDRIDLLRETNATLEAIAQALFKSWFVDFDPVHANIAAKNAQQGAAQGGAGAAQGTTAGMPEAGQRREPLPTMPAAALDAATAALFPDSFEESELGLVPRGWEVGKLQDLLVLQRGFDLPASDRIEGKYPLIAASGPNGTHNIAMAKGPGVVTGRSGVLGKVFLTLEDYWPLNTTLWVKEFKRASPCYAFEILKKLDFASFNAGSAVPTLNRNHIHSLQYLLPPVALVQAYEALARPVHELVLENTRQAQTLTQLRDTLLPRLISGQLRLPKAESLLETMP